MTSQRDTWLRYMGQIDALTEAGLHDFASRVRGIVSEMLGIADSAIGDFISDPQNVLPIVVNALDQVIDRGDDTVGEVFTEYAADVSVAIEQIAPEMGFTVEQMSELTNLAISQAAANNYQLIRQIIPPIRTDIINVFTASALRGDGVSAIEEALREIGLPLSPTGRYSPGWRAMAIAWTEMSRISNSMNDAAAALAEMNMCYNVLNKSLSTHSDGCIAATAAGLITAKDMIDRFGDPPRHPMCGCHKIYSKPSWYKASDTTGQLDRIRSQGINVDKALARWTANGTAENQRRDKWRANLQWENDFINRFFDTKEKAA